MPVRAGEAVHPHHNCDSFTNLVDSNDPAITVTVMDAWMLQELVDEVNRATADLTFADARVAARLDARTVRYYQSLGLIDRPERAGRGVVYGRAHRDRLVAVRRLLAAGLSLSRVGRTLAGLTEPDDLDAAVAAAVAERRAATGAPGVGAFWEKLPSAVPAPSTNMSSSLTASSVTSTGSPVSGRGEFAAGAAPGSVTARAVSRSSFAAPAAGSVVVVSPTLRVVSDTPLDAATAARIQSAVSSALSAHS